MCWTTSLRSTCLAAPGLRCAHDELRVREKSEESATATAAITRHFNKIEPFRHCCNLKLRVIEQQIVVQADADSKSLSYRITGNSVRCIRPAARRSRATATQPHSTEATSGFSAAWMRLARPRPRCTACRCRRQTPLHYQSVPYTGTRLRHLPAVTLSGLRWSVFPVERPAEKVMAGHSVLAHWRYHRVGLSCCDAGCLPLPAPAI